MRHFFPPISASTSPAFLYISNSFSEPIASIISSANPVSSFTFIFSSSVKPSYVFSTTGSVARLGSSIVSLSELSPFHSFITRLSYLSAFMLGNSKSDGRSASKSLTLPSVCSNDDLDLKSSPSCPILITLPSLSDNSFLIAQSQYFQDVSHAQLYRYNT